MIDASPALTPNSRATCGTSGSAARMVATEANAAGAQEHDRADEGGFAHALSGTTSRAIDQGSGEDA